MDKIKEAIRNARWRGHNMSPPRPLLNWNNQHVGSISDCTICGAYVQELFKPKANEIDIGGSAVALNCPAEKTW